MPKLITFSCFMLFWVFYEMSGGSEFKPQERVVVSQAPFTQDAERQLTYQPEDAAPHAMSASYVPVSTEPLTAVSTLSIAQQPTQTPIAPIPLLEPEPEVAAIDLRFVAGNRVNLRRGPGTNHQVVDTLPRGTAAEVIVVNDHGWAQIRLTETGMTGWMSTRLLSDG